MGVCNICIYHYFSIKGAQRSKQTLDIFDTAGIYVPTAVSALRTIIDVHIYYILHTATELSFVTYTIFRSKEPLGMGTM